MVKTADDYWDDSAGLYRFPTLFAALRHAEEMPEDAQFVIADPEDSSFMRRYERLFG